MKSFSGEKLRKLEALKRTPVNRRLLAIASSLAIAIPAAGCGDKNTATTDSVEPPKDTPVLNGKGKRKSDPQEGSASPRAEIKHSFKMPKTSHIGVVTGVKKDDLVAAGYNGDVDSLPVLGDTIDEQGLEEMCQEEARENVENMERAAQGDTEAGANAGMTAVVNFFNEDGDYSKYTCVENEAYAEYMEMYEAYGTK